MKHLPSVVMSLLALLASSAQATPTLVVEEASPPSTAGSSRLVDYRLRLDGIDAVRAVMVRAEWPQADARSVSLSLDPPYEGTRQFRKDPEGPARRLRFAMVFPQRVPPGADASGNVLATLHGEVPPQAVAVRPTLTARVVTREGSAIDVPISYVESISLGRRTSTTTQLAVSSANPSPGATQIRYVLAQRGEAALVVFDSRGRKVRVLATGFQEPGEYSLSWDGRDDALRTVPPGVYFLRLLTRDAVRTHKLILMR